jgi:hypothetical protein
MTATAYGMFSQPNAEQASRQTLAKMAKPEACGLGAPSGGKHQWPSGECLVLTLIERLSIHTLPPKRLFNLPLGSRRR